MNKTDLINFIADTTGLTKSSSSAALDAVIDGIIEGTTQGSVRVPGLGTFGTGYRNPRQGRNPRTGETIQIAGGKTVKFKAAKAFKDAVKA